MARGFNNLRLAGRNLQWERALAHLVADSEAQFRFFFEDLVRQPDINLIQAWISGRDSGVQDARVRQGLPIQQDAQSIPRHRRRRRAGNYSVHLPWLSAAEAGTVD